MSANKLTLPLLLALTAAGCDRPPEADPATPEAYALQLPLEPAKGATLQRLTLPAQVLVALRRANLGDVRVFDSRGKIVPLALAENSADVLRRSVSVPVYQVVGSGAALGSAGLTIRIEDNDAARVVTVDSASPPTDSVAPTAAVLLDTQGLREPAYAIVLDAEIPAGQPVTLNLQTSSNLKNWEPLAEKVLFSPAGGSTLLGGASVELSGVDLHGRYVGISWAGATGVTLKGASVVTSAGAPPTRTAVATSGLSLTDAHELRFDLPHLAGLAAIRLTETGSDGVVPVKLFGRNDQDDPWKLLSVATLRPDARGTLINLLGPARTSYRLEADSRTAGFSSAPDVELLFEPVDLLVALSGTPPYRLTAGLATAPANYLTLSEISPQGKPPKLDDLPKAKLALPDGQPPVVALEPGEAASAFERRKLVLWIALLLGTLVLAFAAIRLLRSAPAAKNE